jgi:hypothetical protein
MQSSENHKGTACGAKKRNGEPCPTFAMPNGRCRMDAN